MAKRAILTFVLLTVGVSLVGVVYATLFASDDGAPATPKSDRGNATAKPWDGKLVRVLNTSFVRQTGELRLQGVRYTHMNSAATDIDAVFVIAAPTATRPKWLTSSTFQVRSTTQRIYKHTVKFKTSGASILATVSARNLPTAALTGNCNAALGDRINLLVYPVDGLFGVCLDPPAAPAGHTYNSAKAAPASCASAKAALTATRRAARARTRAIARAKTRKGKRKLARADKRADRADSAQTAKLRALIASVACNPRRPSAGRALRAADRKRDARHRLRSTDPGAGEGALGPATAGP